MLDGENRETSRTKGPAWDKKGQPELSDVFSYDQRLASGTSFIWPQITTEIGSSLPQASRAGPAKRVRAAAPGILACRLDDG